MENSRYKFRAWDKKKKKFMADILLDHHGFQYYFPVAEADKFDLVSKKNEHEISLFTGLHDKNGKEIYEGDIVRYFKNVCIGEIIYYPPHYMIRDEYGDHFISEFDKNLEVIGNIHEHPELLEKDKK